MDYKIHSESAKTSEHLCLLCSREFNLLTDFTPFLAHIFEEHKLIIENPQCIDLFEKYVDYWRDKFLQTCIEEIIPAFPSSKDRQYFLLSTLTKEDKELRHKLKLEKMLEIQNIEREDSAFKKQCLFCKLFIEGTRIAYCNHLRNDHNLRLGNPLNLVYVDELLDKIESHLKNLVCIYCEKIFKDRTTLLEHMRKKYHKRVNPLNKQYDKFYATNYLYPDRNWDDTETQFDLGGENADEEYDDWKESDEKIVCLFCKKEDTTIKGLNKHMHEEHRFDFDRAINNLDFYQRVKAVNYIRKQIDVNRCIFCDMQFESNAALDSHLNENDHFNLPELQQYDKPQFFYPTLENDMLLSFLEEVND